MCSIGIFFLNFFASTSPICFSSSPIFSSGSGTEAEKMEDVRVHLLGSESDPYMVTKPT